MGPRRVMAALGAAAAMLAQAAPAAAGTGAAISTVAGGPGSGPAVNVGQYAVAVTASGSRVWVLDGDALRVIDTTTGQESEPFLSITPPAGGFHPDMPTMAADSAGDVFLAFNGDGANGGMVEELTAAGQVKVVAGGGSIFPEHTDWVPATEEPLGTVNGVAVDGDGNVYVAENDWSDGRFTTTLTSSRIRKVSPKGNISTVVDATGSPGYAGDGGSALVAELNAPRGLATDSKGDLYIADFFNNRVRMLDTRGLIITVAGGGTATGNGVPAVSAKLFEPSSVAVLEGSVVVQDDYDYLIRAVVDGTITTIAGTGTPGDGGDGGPASRASILPQGIATGPGGVYLVQGYAVGGAYTSYTANWIRLIGTTGTIERYAGTGWAHYGGDGGPALHAQFSEGRMAVDPGGAVYLTDTQALRVRRIDASGTVSTVAGSGTQAYPHDTGDGGPATAATFRSITDVAVGPDGGIYIIDNADFRVRRVDPATGIITTVAGTGVEGNTGDGGPATAAELGNPLGLAFDPAGRLVITDACLLRRVDPTTGIITTVAGSDPCGESGDGGPAAAAKFGLLVDVVIDPLGDIYVADHGFTESPPVERVREISAHTGIVTTVAGGGTDGVGGPATQASIEADALGFDGAGDLLIVDTSFYDPTNGQILGVDSGGTLFLEAGGGSGPDGGQAVGALLDEPTDTALDPAGNLLVDCLDARTPYGGGAVRSVSPG